MRSGAPRPYALVGNHESVLSIWALAPWGAGAERRDTHRSCNMLSIKGVAVVDGAVAGAIAAWVYNKATAGDDPGLNAA